LASGVSPVGPAVLFSAFRTGEEFSGDLFGLTKSSKNCFLVVERAGCEGTVDDVEAALAIFMSLTICFA
jgi:hypothetical protein